MQTHKKMWHFEKNASLLEKPPNKKYELAPAAPADLQRIASYYLTSPVPGYDIGQVDMIYNPNMIRKFELYVDELQEKKDNPAFEPDWEKEEQKAGTSSKRIAWRKATNQRLQNMAAPYIITEHPDVKLLPMWHGTRPLILDSIFRSGYANLSKTDEGFFGKGLYFSHEAEYANRVYSRGALLMNWVVFFAAYPVIHGDMPKLRAKANYKQYDAHFVPVVPANPGKPNEVVYYPTKPGQNPIYHEMVLFQTAACLPWGIVRLQSLLTKTPASESAEEPLATFEGGDLNKPIDAGGNTLLHMALKQHKSWDYIQILLEKGADYKARNREGERPIDLADTKTLQFIESQHRMLKRMTNTLLTAKVELLEKRAAHLNENAMEPTEQMMLGQRR